MQKKIPIPICQGELENGYIFKFFFTSISFKGCPITIFSEDCMYAPNASTDNNIYNQCVLHGDEINLTWDEKIEKKERILCLKFESTSIPSTFGQIKKKDPARIVVAQMRTEDNIDKFYGQDSSNEFIIYISCGAGGDQREGIQSISAQRINPKEIEVNEPGENAARLNVPVKTFKRIIDAFIKYKKKELRLCFYDNRSKFNIGGLDTASCKNGIILTTDSRGGRGGHIEKYGDITDDLDNEDVKKECPNEYIIESDKINFLSKFASMHNEGSVRIYYEEGCDLKISFRFGCFGESTIYIHNKYKP